VHYLLENPPQFFTYLRKFMMNKPMPCSGTADVCQSKAEPPWQINLGRLSLKKRAKIRALLPRARSWGPGRYLEIGPEKGVLAWHLKTSHAGYFFHVDGDIHHLRSTRELTGEPVVRIGDSLPFADHSFDGVLLVDHLEHVEDDHGLLLEAKRVLRPGGPLLASAPRLPGTFGSLLRRILGMRKELYGHVRDGYTPTGLNAMVTAAGFRIEESGLCVGPLTETLELLLNATFTLVGRIKGFRGGSKGTIAPQNRQEAEGSRRLVAAYRLFFPLFRLLTLPDRLLASQGSVVWVTARKDT
jgi:SAM-dependent methyltransferase